MAGREKQAEIRTVMDLLDEIESETLYLALVTVDRRTLQIVLLKVQGYSTKEMREAWNLYRKNLLLPAQGGLWKQD